MFDTSKLILNYIMLNSSLNYKFTFLSHWLCKYRSNKFDLSVTITEIKNNTISILKYKNIDTL